MRTVVEQITPAHAKHLLDTTNPPENRVIRESLVEALYRSIIGGRWMLTHQGIAFDVQGRLIDGQHRLTAIYCSGVTVPMNVTYGVDPDTFAVVDTGARRSAGDVLAPLTNLGGTAGLAAAMVRVVLCYREARKEVWPTFGVALGKRRDNSEIIQAFNKYEHEDSEVRLTDYVLTARRVSHATALGPPSAVGGALFQIARHNPAGAQSFIAGILEGAGLMPGDPRLTLRNRRNVKEIGHTRRRAGSAKTIQAFGMLANGYRAYEEGRRWSNAVTPTKLPVIGPSD